VTLAAIALLLAGTAYSWPSNPFRQGPCPRIQDCREQYLPTPVKPSDTSAVQRAIDAAKLAGARELSLRAQVEAIEAAASTDPTRLQSPTYLSLLSKHKTARETKYTAYNAAIDAAVRAYRLEPPIKDIRDRAGYPPSHSRAEPWRPRFSEKEIRDANGNMVPRTATQLTEEAARNARVINGHYVNGGVVVARTGDAGNTMLFDAAFDSPDRLAMTIYHETSHWVDANAAGGMNPYRKPAALFLSEALAYDAEGKLARTLGRSNERTSLIAAQYRFQSENSGNKSIPQLKLEHPDWLFPEMAEGTAPLPEPGDAGWPEYERLRGEDAFANASRAFEAEKQRIVEETARMYPRASPAPHPATSVDSGYGTPVLVAPPAASTVAPRRTADHDMLAMVSAACRGDWASAGTYITSYSELWDIHVRALEGSASARPDGCARSLLYRVAAMRRAGETLDLARLQSETASLMLPPAHVAGPDERERPGDGRPRGGAAPGDRPSERGAERRLGNGWRGF
jgi:hypothetical protein